MLRPRVVIMSLVRCSLFLPLLAAACSSAPLQPTHDGEGIGGTWGTPGVAGTTGVAGTAGAAGGPNTCLLHYNSALVIPPADACCAWEGGLNTCNRDIACNGKSGAKCCQALYGKPNPVH